MSMLINIFNQGFYIKKIGVYIALHDHNILACENHQMSFFRASTVLLRIALYACLASTLCFMRFQPAHYVLCVLQPAHYVLHVFVLQLAHSILHIPVTILHLSSSKDDVRMSCHLGYLPSNNVTSYPPHISTTALLISSNGTFFPNHCKQRVSFCMTPSA